MDTVAQIIFGGIVTYIACGVAIAIAFHRIDKKHLTSNDTL